MTRVPNNTPPSTTVQSQIISRPKEPVFQLDVIEEETQLPYSLIDTQLIPKPGWRPMSKGSNQSQQAAQAQDVRYTDNKFLNLDTDDEFLDLDLDNQRPVSRAVVSKPTTRPQPQPRALRRNKPRNQQSTSHRVIMPLAPSISTAPRTIIGYTKSKETAMIELEMPNHQRYLAGLNRDRIYDPAQRVYPDIAPSSALFINAVRKTRRDYKNWNAQVIKNAEPLVTKYLHSHPNRFVRCMTTFKELRAIINVDFHYHWCERMFHYAYEVVDFDRITPLGRSFLSCKYPLLLFRYPVGGLPNLLDSYIQLVVHTRLSMIQARKQLSLDVSKYNRSRFLTFYDGLWRYKDFTQPSIIDFSLRDGPLVSKRLKRNEVDPNDDLDGEVDEDFHINTPEPILDISLANELDDETDLDQTMHRCGIARLWCEEQSCRCTLRGYTRE